MHLPLIIVITLSLFKNAFILFSARYVTQNTVMLLVYSDVGCRSCLSTVHVHWHFKNHRKRTEVETFFLFRALWNWRYREDGKCKHGAKSYLGWSQERSKRDDQDCANRIVGTIIGICLWYGSTWFSQKLSKPSLYHFDTFLFQILCSLAYFISSNSS